MIFMYVTNPRNYDESLESAFEYLDSHKGKRFPLSWDGAGFNTAWINWPSLQISCVGYGFYLPGLDNAIDEVNSSNSDDGNFTGNKPALYQNPFNIRSLNFTPAGKSVTVLTVPSVFSGHD